MQTDKVIVPVWDVATVDMYEGGLGHNPTLQQASRMSQQSGPRANVFMIVLSTTRSLHLPSFPVSLIITLTHYHTLHLSCSLWDSHIQLRSLWLFLVVRLTPFTSCGPFSLSQSFSVHLVTAQIYYCNLSVLLSRLLTHSMATIMHMLLLVSYRHIHWNRKKPRADKQKWLNIVSMKSDSTMTHYEHPSSECGTRWNETFVKLTTIRICVPVDISSVTNLGKKRVCGIYSDAYVSVKRKGSGARLRLLLSNV